MVQFRNVTGRARVELGKADKMITPEIILGIT